MDSPDRYAFIEELCRMPESVEERLRRCRFAGEPEPSNDDEDDEDVGFPVESTGIVMVSPPETPAEGADEETALPRDAEGDVFHIPTEAPSLAGSRNSSAAVEERGRETEEAVDLGRDTDIGLDSEAEVAGGLGGGGVEFEPAEIRVSGRRNLGVSSNSGKESNSQPKRLKISDAEADLGSPRDSLGPETASERRKSIDDIDKFKYDGGRRDSGGSGRGKRALPGWIRGWKDGEEGRRERESRGEEGGSNGNARKEVKETTLLDVLKMIADAQCCDDDFAGLEGLSVLDAAKRKGMTFP